MWEVPEDRGNLVSVSGVTRVYRDDRDGVGSGDGTNGGGRREYGRGSETGYV